MAKQKLVVLTGAGISAESGLRTFRDSDGLWEGYNIEDVASPRGWRTNPQVVLDFYNARRKDVIETQPNAAHKALADLQVHFDVHIVTQNIDDLHERAGSKKVLHLHGEIVKMRSDKDPLKYYPYKSDIVLGQLAPDGTQFRPHVVWFEEPVPMIEEAIPILYDADIFVLIGTSLAVYPAAGLVDYVKEKVTKYVIDKKIPAVSRYKNVVPIEKVATEGMLELIKLLPLNP
jgi:NAD-dependent deacetylase